MRNRGFQPLTSHSAAQPSSIAMERPARSRALKNYRRGWWKQGDSNEGRMIEHQTVLFSQSEVVVFVGEELMELM